MIQYVLLKNSKKNISKVVLKCKNIITLNKSDVVTLLIVWVTVLHHHELHARVISKNNLFLRLSEASKTSVLCYPLKTQLVIWLNIESISRLPIYLLSGSTLKWRNWGTNKIKNFKISLSCFVIVWNPKFSDKVPERRVFELYVLTRGWYYWIKTKINNNLGMKEM